ncbi:MAG: hypothetical protein IPJ88_00760 [Myxococcales bacterium]|nr:MAG: hypothetical protein IPJ88_00760 [Myxococcales bacterium]
MVVRSIVVVAGIALCSLRATPSSAYHDEKQSVVTDTAHQLDRHESRLGIWRYDYGFAPWLQLGTYHFLWLLRVPNLQAKLNLYQDKDWTIALSTGFAWVNLGNFKSFDKNSNARITSLPFQAAVSYRFNRRFELSVMPSYTYTVLKGDYEADEFEGLAAVSNLQWVAVLQWRFSRVFALMLHARWLVFQGAAANVSSTVSLDDFTTARVHAAVKTDALDFKAYSLVPSMLFSWSSFNLRVGLGYGNYNVPLFNFVLPTKSIIPELDVFWRF